ncbi:hypothetical protein K438DRAFT_1871933, partial [Mycena galopus ATCC 62051]
MISAAGARYKKGEKYRICGREGGQGFHKEDGPGQMDGVQGREGTEKRKWGVGRQEMEGSPRCMPGAKHTINHKVEQGCPTRRPARRSDKFARPPREIRVCANPHGPGEEPKNPPNADTPATRD